MAAVRPQIGLALSAGGAPAMAEIGAIDELIAAGIPFDVVAGTSAGAMIGAAYAAGRLPEFAATMRALTRRRVLSLFDPTWPRAGLLEGRRAMELIRPHVGTTFETLLRPFAAVATDLRTGDEVVFTSGNVIDAIRASIAIPGVFTPKVLGEAVLVDGGIVNPLPVSAARGLGADFVVALSVLTWSGERGARARSPSPRPLLARLLARAGARRAAARALSRHRAAAREKEEAFGLIEVILDATRIVERRLVAARLKEEPPDFLLEIQLPRIGIFDFQLSAEVIEIGRETARAALPDLRRALARKNPSFVRRWAGWRKRHAQAYRAGSSR